jgi:hypothetical protein
VSNFWSTYFRVGQANGIADYGLRIGDGGAFEKRQLNICTNAR